MPPRTMVRRGAAAAAPHRAKDASPARINSLASPHASPPRRHEESKRLQSQVFKSMRMAAQVSASTANEQKRDFRPADIAHMTMLSRVVEPLRFTVGPDYLEEKVSAATLKQAFTEHFAHCVEGPDERQQELDQVHRNVDLCMNAIERDHSCDIGEQTIGDVFDFEFPLFPESTAEQREQLLALAEREDFITREDVVRELGLSFGVEAPARPRSKSVAAASVRTVEEDETLADIHVPELLGGGQDEKAKQEKQLLDFIFASGAKVLPREVFRDIVESLGKHPRGAAFILTFMRSLLETGKVMSTLGIHIALLVMVLALAPRVVTVAHQALHENMFHFVDNDWTQGCPNGTRSPLGCRFLARSFMGSTRPEYDADRYLKEELIKILWRDEGPAARVPIGATYLVGALVIRGVRGVSSPVPNQYPCEALNLTRSTFHWEVPMQFDCGHDWAAVIPFGVNRSTALRMAAQQVRMPPKDATTTYSIITHIAGFSPSTNDAVYAKVLLTFPSGGSLMPRVQISPIDTTLHEDLLPLMIVRIIGFVWGLFVAWRYGRVGIGWAAELTLEVILTAMIVGAYVTLKSVAGRIDDIEQTAWAPSGFDDAAAQFDNGMSLFGFFVLFFVCTSIRYSKHIRGLQLLYDILDAAWLEIVGLIFMFLVWSVGFVFVAMSLFGSSVVEFSNVAVAMRTLLLYFIGVRDLQLLFENNPITGPIFFFTFNLFVVFFALNLLIAVLTAPLGAIKARHDLQRSTFDKTRARLAEAPMRERVYLELQYRLLWPLLNLALDCFWGSQGHWLTWYESFLVFFELPDDNIDKAVQLTGAAARLLSLMTPRDTKRIEAELEASQSQATSLAMEQSILPALKAVHNVRSAQDLWRTPLAHTIVTDEVLARIPMALVFVTVAEESRIPMLRDARLVRCLRGYDAFVGSTSAIEDLQSQLRSGISRRSDPLKVLLEHAVKNAQRDTPRFEWTKLREKVKPPSQTAVTNFDDVGLYKEVVEAICRQHDVVMEASRRQEAPPVFGGIVNVSMALQCESESGSDGGSIRSGTPQPAAEEDEPETSTTGKKRKVTVRVAGEEDEREPAQQQSPQAGAAAAPGQQSPEEDSVLERSQMLVQAALDKDVDGDGEEGLAFIFARDMTNELANASHILFYSLATLIFGAIFFAPFVVSFDTAAHLHRSLNLGLRDIEIFTECYDANCRSAWSVNKTFLHVGDMGEYYQWLDGVLDRQIYLRDVLGLPHAGTGSVYWDERVHLDGPIYLRQLRSKRGGCGVDIDTNFNSRADRGNTSCFLKPQEFGFDQAPLARSRTASALVPDSAYVYSDYCPEKEPKIFHGSLLDYPCEGYGFHVHNRSQLRAAIAAKYWDDATRLASITAPFRFGNSTRVEYTLHMEFTEGGGGSFGRAFGFALESESDVSDLAISRMIFQIFVALDLLLLVGYTARYLVARFVQDLPSEEVDDLKPSVRVFTLLIGFATFVGANVVFPPREQETRNNVAIVILAIIYLEYNFTTAIVFPAAMLLSKKVKVLIKTLSAALMQIGYVVPYFVIVTWGFLLGGFIIFGRFVLPLGRLRWATMEVSAMAFDGNIDYIQLQNARFVEAVLFVILFFAAILVVLANMFLAMVTSASGDAQETAAGVALSEEVLRVFGYRVMYGEFLSSFLYLSVKIADGTSALGAILPSALRRPRQREPAFLLNQGRALFPAEVLLSTMHPVLVHELLTKFRTGQLNTLAYAALGPFLLEHFDHFVAGNPHKRAVDVNWLSVGQQMAAAKRFIVLLEERLGIIEESDEDAAGNGNPLEPGAPAAGVAATAEEDRDSIVQHVKPSSSDTPPLADAGPEASHGVEEMDAVAPPSDPDTGKRAAGEE